MCNLFWFSVILFSLLLQYVMVDFNVSTICQNLYSLMKSYYYSCTYVWMSSHCFLRFFILMKQLNRLYHFTYMILRWKKKWRASIINVHKIMFEWTSYLQHELFFEIFLLWWNKRDCITLRIVDIIFRWKKNEFFSHSEFSADLCILWFYLGI